MPLGRTTLDSLLFAVYFHGCICVCIGPHPSDPPARSRGGRDRCTTQPVESSLRSEMQRKFLLQPPLPLLQSRTGPKESRRTSRLSKDDEVISSSLWGDQGVGGVEVTLGADKGHRIPRASLADQDASRTLLQKFKIDPTLSLEQTNHRHCPHLGTELRRKRLV